MSQPGAFSRLTWHLTSFPQGSVCHEGHIRHTIGLKTLHDGAGLAGHLMLMHSSSSLSSSSDDATMICFFLAAGRVGRGFGAAGGAGGAPLLSTFRLLMPPAHSSSVQ